MKPIVLLAAGLGAVVGLGVVVPLAVAEYGVLQYLGGAVLGAVAGVWILRRRAVRLDR
jgi:hypothetical protein